jgi:hypothetical protein
MAAAYKTCPCGAVLTKAEWLALPLKGYQPDGPNELELRNHSCGSTLALQCCPDCGEPVGDGEEGRKTCCCEATAAHAGCRLSCSSCCCGDSRSSGAGDSEGYRSAMREAGRAGELR